MAKFVTVKPNEKLTHCSECGMRTSSVAEYHPWLFCMLYKAGVKDPARYLADCGYVRRGRTDG